MENENMKFSQTFSTDLEHVAKLRILAEKTGMSKSQIINRLIDLELARIDALEAEVKPTK